MAHGLNKAIVIGRLNSPVELRRTSNGYPVAAFTLAIPWLHPAAEALQESETIEVGIVTWGDLAESCHKQFCYGDTLCAEGQLRTRHWQDQEQQTRCLTELYAHEVSAMGTSGQAAARP
jgi:single-strand DNA-binding protein